MILCPLISFLGKDLVPVPSAKDLGVILDSGLTFNNHITALTSSLLSTLCQINRVRHLFDKSILLVILNSLVFSKLFYCSTVWSGTTKQNICKLQLIQNFAARVLTGTKKFDHISPILNELGWLPVKVLLLQRDLTMMYKCLNGLTPDYLSSKVVKRSHTHSRFTRQSDDIDLTRCRTSLAQRSFFYRAAKSWNSLDRTIRNCTSLDLFKKAVKLEISHL